MTVVRLFLDPKRRWKSQKNFNWFAKTWRTKYNTVTAQKTCHSLLSSTDIHFFHTIHHVYRVAKLIVYRFYELDLKFISFMEVSYPKNKAALDGAARNNVGTNPLYRAFGPSSRIRQRNTSRTPRGYVPSGAVWYRVFSTSKGKTTVQKAMPANPPATATEIVPASSRDSPGSDIALRKLS